MVQHLCLCGVHVGDCGNAFLVVNDVLCTLPSPPEGIVSKVIFSYPLIVLLGLPDVYFQVSPVPGPVSEPECRGTVHREGLDILGDPGFLV